MTARGVVTNRIPGGGPAAGVEEKDAPKYTFQAKGSPLMTLFRCKMRTKAFWWFIR